MTSDAPPRERVVPGRDAGERHGPAWRLLPVWAAPNLGLPAVLVGVIAVEFFGLGPGQAVAACLLGAGLGGAAHGLLSSWGPPGGLDQMSLARGPFGHRGAALPALLNAATLGVGWCAVRAVTGALAFAALTGWPAWLGLLLVAAAATAVAAAGTARLHAVQRLAFPVLALVFAIGAVPILLDARFGAPGAGGGIGGFLLASAAAFGHTAVWAPCAADHSRHLPADTGRLATGLAAGLGTGGAGALLMVGGAASATIGAEATGDPVADVVGTMPGGIARLVLLGVVLGSFSANAMSLASGATSLRVTGVRAARPVLLLGALGGALAWPALDDAAHAYEAFLLVAAAWIAPWLGVVLTDRLMRRRHPDGREHPAGPIALGVATVLSLWLFADQENHVGLVPARWPAAGDLTPIAGFLLAAALYAAITRSRPLR